MQFLSFKAACGCFLIAALMSLLHNPVPAQDNSFKQKENPAAEPIPEAATPAIATESTDPARFDDLLRESGGKDPMAYLARAQGSLVEKNRYRIVDDLENAERLDSKDSELHAQRGEAKVRMGDYAGAMRDFQAGALLGNDPGYRHGMYTLALHFTGNSQLAINELTQAIRKEPELTSNYDLRGLIYRSVGNRAAAMKDHDHSIKVSPDNAYGFCERACTNFAFGNYAAAKKDFDRAIQFGVTDSYLYHYYANFLATCEDESFRDPKRALLVAGVALELNPNDGYALHAKACALALEGEYEVALAAALRAREDREFANDPELGGGVEAKAYLTAWKQGKPHFRTPNKEK